jgi:hypothetical protein
MVLTGWVARQKGRNTTEGIILGLLFGLLGLIVELCLPAKREQATAPIRAGADAVRPYAHTRSMRRQGQSDADAIRRGALYYAVTAQLEGWGSVSDSVTEVVTTKCSGQAAKTESFTLATGQASDGYAIATAEFAGGDRGNATQAESDAGC